jgi:transposase-like protein
VAQADLAVWLKRWEKRYPKLTDWVEAHIAETFTFYRLPRQHHTHLTSTNLLERLNAEIRRRSYVVRIFCNEESCLRLVGALCAEIHENWIDDNRYLDMSVLQEQRNEQLRAAA